MKGKASLAALRIAAIKEEFAESEILEAINILEGQGSTSALLNYLAKHRQVSNMGQRRSRKTKPLEAQRSKAVVELEYQDPDKFQILSEFDTMLRKSHVLPGIDDIRRLGERLSKSFVAPKSRREAISKLLTVLTSRPLDEVKEIVQATLSTARVDEKDSDYQRLARFIMTGKDTQSEHEQRFR